MSSRKEEEDHIKERERQFRVTSGGNLAGASNISHKASEPGASFVESSPELLDMWSTGPGGQADGGPKNTREQMEKSIKDRERQFRTAMPGAVAVSEPDVSGSFTVPSTSSASSNIWGAKKTPSQAPSTASPERMSVREQEDERTKDRGRAARIGSLRGLGGEVNNVQVSEPDTSNEVAVSSAVSGASLNVWGHKSAPSVGNSASVPRSTSPTPSDSSNVWAKKTQTEAPSAAARASLPVSSKGPSTKELEDLAIKERERATRMYTVTTNPAGQARSFTSNQTPASEPDMPAASLTTSAVIHAPGAPKSEASSAIASMTAPQRDPIRILSINRSTEQEDEQIKDRERQFRTGTAASGPIVSTIRPDGGAVSGMNQSQTSLNSSFSASTMRAGKNETTTKGLVDEDEIIKARERQNRTAHVTGLTTLAGGNILTAGALQNAAPDVELVEVPAEMVFQSVVSEAYTANSIDRSAISSRDSTLPEKSRTGPRSLRGLVATGESTQPGVVRDDSAAEERIRAKSGRHATSVGNSNILTAGALQNEAPDVELVEVSPDMMFQSVVSEAYTANSVDRSAISSRDSTLPEKSRTGPRGLRGLGATAATGESTQPGVVRDDSAAEEMIRAKRGRHAASVGNSNMGTSTFDLAVKSETHGIPVSVPVESVGRADEEEYIPKGAFRVYGNGIIVQQQPGILSDQMPESVPEISAEMGASAFPPPDPEEPNDGPTSVSTAAYLVPDARKIDETDNEGKSEDLPFYKSRTFFALIGIIVLAAIAIGVGVALSGGGGGGGSDGEVASAPTAAPTEDPIYQARKVFFTNFLENEGMDVESLEDSSSSQNKAFNWILNDVEISRIAENSTDDEIQVALSRYVLAVFYYSLNGSTWIRDSGWLNATLGHCSWEFISCDGADLITNISTGSFIEYLVDSPDALQAALDHGGNNLEGILPSELKHFTSLVELHLQNNLITGIDGLHEGMSDLRVLNLGGNQIADLSMVYTLPSLEILNLHNTRKGGSIDTRLGGLLNLRQLILSNNELNGSASTVFNQMGLLEKLLLGGNALSGDIGEVLSGKNNLEVITAKNNKIGGDIGDGLLNLTSIKDFVFSGAELTGSIPSEIGRLESLFSFIVNDNELTGTLPSELGLLGRELANFQVSQTRLSGPIPPEFWELSRLHTLYLDSTSLTGTIPDIACGRSRLQQIRISCGGGIVCPPDCVKCVCL